MVQAILLIIDSTGNFMNKLTAIPLGDRCMLIIQNFEWSVLSVIPAASQSLSALSFKPTKTLDEVKR